MDPSEILAKAHQAAATRHRRSFDPDAGTMPGRLATALASEREHDEAQKEFLEQGKALVADAMRRGARFEDIRGAQAVFLAAMELRRGLHRNACRAWASGASGYLPPPLPDVDPVFDLADALWAKCTDHGTR